MIHISKIKTIHIQYHLQQFKKYCMIHNKYWLVFIFLLFFNLIQAQDIDVYTRVKNDNIKMPELYENTLFDEYQILSKDIRMLDMVYGVIVPGYIHFKAKEMKTGYGLLGLRSISYIGLGAVYLSAKARGDKIIDIFNSNAPKHQIVINENWSINTSDLIAGTAVATIISTYLFDWIHGKYKLEKKQELIRYKYSIKIKINQLSQKENANIQDIGLSLNIKF